MAEWSHSPICPWLLYGGAWEGSESGKESWFQIQLEVITDPQQGSSIHSFMLL